MININFVNENKTAIVPKGTTILDAARNVGIIIESPCNKIGTCGKCKVRVENLKAKNVVSDEVRHRLSNEETEDGYVLSCQARAYEDINVEVIKSNKTLKIVSEGQSFSYEIKSYITKVFNGRETTVYGGGSVLGVEDGDTTDLMYGLSIDIGTTTLVTALIDMNSGKEIFSVSSLNPQSLYAQDVLTRIKFASSDDGLRTMYKDIINTFNTMIDDVAKKANIDNSYIYEVVYSGNTTMIHLATNVNPSSLGKYPYTPQLVGGNQISAVNLNISPFGVIYLPPIISAYVGPDITSGILASQLVYKKGITLFIDIGTNGEMVIAKGGKLSATSTAAGPAFEGMNITCGMRAGSGAIELFDIKGEDIEIQTIDNTTPKGICGSGLLDIVGELVRVGIIGKNGKFVTLENSNLNERLVKVDGKLIFQIADNVYLTQKDIRQVQLAKGAVRAGVEALLESKDLKAEDVDTVQIAGSFGFHLRAKSLINMGLLPKEFEGKIEYVGNTSKTGGITFLLNTDFRNNMKEIVKKIEVVELANKESFDKIFVKALGF